VSTVDSIVQRFINPAFMREKVLCLTLGDLHDVRKN
jgi:hypothetical protein